MNGFKISKQEISKLKGSLNFMKDVLEKKLWKIARKHERHWRKGTRYLQVPGRSKLSTWQTGRARR